MTSRTLGHRAPLLWLRAALMAGLAVGKASEIAPTSWLLGGAFRRAVIANFAAWRGSRAWAPALATAMFLAGDASYVLHRARLAAWEGLRRARRGCHCAWTAPFRKRSVAHDRARDRRSRSDPARLVGQRVYFSLSLRRGETTPRGAR